MLINIQSSLVELQTNLVISRASHVADPLDSLVGGLLVDLQETHVQSRGGERGHSENDVNWGLVPHLLLSHLQHLDLR